MSKRILAMLLAIVLVLGCMPVAVLAEEAPAEHKCEHCDQVPEWVDWDGTAPLEDGKHYRLTAEKLTLSAPIALSAGTYVLCLNGHTISGATAGRIFDLSGTASLTILDHTAKTEEGVYTAGKLADATNSAVYVKDQASFTVYDGIMENNKRPSGKDGGCIFLEGTGSVQLKGGLYRNNFARYGAVVYMVGNRANQLRVNLLLENVHITGNTSTHTGAIHGDGLSTITVKDSVITGNSTTGKLSGGLYVTSEEGQLTLSGKVILDGNTNNTADSINRNAILNNAAVLLNVDGLAEGSRIQMNAKKGTDPAQVIVPSNQKAWNCGWVTLGNDSVSWTDGDADGTVQASELVAGHYHNGVAYTAVTGNAALPATGGNFYLTQDVSRTAVTAFGKDTNLCLNGHNIINTGTGRAIQTTKNTTTVLTIEDCTAYTDAEGNYQAGAITGTNMTSSGTVYLNAGTTLKMYGGKISGNTASAAAGVYNAGSFYLYGGEISDNHATKGTSGRHGGGVYNAGTFVMEGGIIKDNEALNYGGGVFSNKAATITGGIITGNQAVQGGGVGLYNSNEFTIGAVTISDNTATAEGGGLWAANGAKVTLTDTVITGNTVTGTDKGGGGVAARDKAKVTMVSGQISANQAPNSQGGGLFAVTENTELIIEGGVVSENTAKFGGGALISTKAKLTLKGGSMEKNTASAQGGGAYISSGTNFHMEGGAISGNTAKRSGGGIYNLASTSHISGGTIENNVTEENGGGICLAGTSTLNLSGGKITGNSAPVSGGVHTTESSVLNISGNPQVTGNSADTIASNLNLAGETLLMNVGEMTEGALVSVRGVPFRAISAPVATDCSSFFASDSSLYAVKYVEGALYLDVAVEHNHCLCNAAIPEGCDHSALKFIPWESTTTLPTSGNYYLTADVEVSAQTRLENNDLNLCLNGHTIKVKETGRVYYLADSVTLNITDCAGGGKLTGATASTILTNGAGKDMAINLYGGAITDNHSTDHGGAIVIQGGTIFTMYGGEISGNSVAEGKYGGAMYVGTGATFKLLGGKISENAATNSGAIYMNRGSAELLGGEISGNTATENGGAVYVTKGQVILNGTAVTGNTAANGAGFMVAEEGILTVKDGKISGNQAENGTGGAILGAGAGATITIEGGTISENAAKFGGGVLIQSKASLTMKGGVIEKNETSAQGGGVYVSTNTAFQMEGGKIAGNTAKRNGGGIYNLSSNTTITGGSVENNRSEENGGGIAINGASQLKISNGTVSGNTAKLNGGGIAIIGATKKDADGKDVPVPAVAELLEGAVITGNATDKDGTGGGVFVKGEETGAVVDGATVSKNKAKYGAGMLCQTKSYIKIKSGKVTGNQSTSNGGGLYISTNTTLYMEGGEVSGNSSKLNGGGAYFLTSKLVMSGGKFSGNTATKDGGGMYLQLSETKFTGGSVTGNTAKNAAGMRITGGKHRISGLSVSYNTAESDGGGIQIGRQMVKENGVNVDKMPDFVVSSITMVGNKAKSGGAMLLLSKGAEYHISNAYIAENNASSGGGGIYVSTGATLNMYNSKILKNYGRTGGGVQHLSSAGYYENVEISGNTGNNAAGMNVTKNGSTKGVTMKNVTLKENVGSASGAMVVQGASHFYADNCQFIGNSTPKTGGAIFVTTSAKAYINNTLFENNSAGADAGAVMLGLKSLLEMDNCQFIGNHAESNGGGVYNRGLMYIRNSKVENNTCGNNGAGIGSGKTGSTHTGNNCGLFLTNVESTGNTANNLGGGLFVSMGCHCIAEDLTLTGNTAKVNGGGVWAQEDFMVHNLTATGNSAECGAVYLAKSYYDGQSYFIGVMKFSGLVQVKDNQGGGVYVGEQTTLTLEGNSLAEGSYIDVTLNEGVLSQKVFGLYNYEGENPTYVLTPGDRSVTDPELPFVEETPTEPDTQPTESQPEAVKPGEDNTLLYAGIGGIAAVLVLAAVVLVIVKKKKSAGAENK